MMKISDMKAKLFLVSLSTLATLSFVACNAEDKSQVPEGYKLVWSDEFDQAGKLDQKNWRFETWGNQYNWWHNERQYYTDGRLENARVEGGRLIIEARPEDMSKFPDWRGQEYSSARVITKGARSWKYGFFEIRAKLACGRGAWPAIWMLSNRFGWPKGGEIDIMEHVGHKQGAVSSALHRSPPNAPMGGGMQLNDVCDAFHNYQLDWRDGSIKTMVDGRVLMEQKKADMDFAAWPYDHDFYLLLNVAVGGAWGGQEGIDAKAFPTKMEVEYVRVYQMKP